MSELYLTDDGWCVACGPNNPWGLHLNFRWEGDDYVCDFVPQRVHQGWAGVTHGGILCILLDEVMNRMLCDDGTPVVTAELRVRFRKPAPTGVPLRMRARVVSSRGRLYDTEAEATLHDGTTVATATAKMMQVEGDFRGRQAPQRP